MKIVLAYIAVCGGPITDDYVARFVTTWQEYPPGAEHDILVIANGGPLTTSTNIMLGQIGSKMLVRSNDGWDIGAYIEASRSACAGYDMMVCCGESVYFHRAGWMDRLTSTWKQYGPGMYSPYSSNAVRAHMNTTAFCCSPELLRNYPRKVSTRQDRYEFEHGEGALWRRAAALGKPVRMVTWDGAWEPFRWRMARNILWRGDQSNCLMWCNHTDGYANADRETRAQWASRADTPFK